VEATRRIRDEANGKPPIVIVLTASALGGQRDAVMLGGVFDDFLAKPCREGELLEKIRVHLNLEFRYDGSETVPAVDGQAAPGPVLGAGLLAELPPDWIDQVRNAVLNGEKDRLDRLIGRVAELDNSAARLLQEVADRYEYDVLARWVEDAAETGTGRQAVRT
jgi:DNA-binding response OmpR family regulator